MTDSDLPTSNDVFPPGSSTAGRRYKCLLAGSLVLLLLAGGEFSLRGPVRTLRPAGSQDFAVYYCCSRAWTEGSDPYSPENLQLIARRSGGAPESFLHNAVSPPATFVVLAPLTALPWAAAKSVWLAINIILLGVVLYEVIRLAGPGLGGAGKILICAFVLALAPLHTGFALGQLALAVTVCVVLALRLETNRRQYLAGVLLGLATVLKPQMGLVFILYALCRLRWRTALSAVGLAGLIAAVSVVRLELAGVDWFASLRANYEAFTCGGDADLDGAKNIAHQMLNLQYPLYLLLDSKALAGAVAVSLTTLAGALAVWAVWRLRDLRGELSAYSIAAVLSLVCVYHRFYDAVFLVLPLAWAFRELRSTLRTQAITSLILIMVFLVPGASLLFFMIRWGWIPSSISQAWWWRALIMPHQVYALAALGGVLIVALIHSGRTTETDLCFRQKIHSRTE